MVDFVVLVIGGLLHVLALPNELVPDGWGVLGLLSLVPVFWFTGRSGPWRAALGGALWILFVTLLSQSWLVGFHPLALPLVLLFQVPWYALAFGVSAFLTRAFPRSALWAQAAWWTVFEFLRIQGSFVFPYGALATAFWAWPLTWQSASLVGTSGVTFLLAWSSAWVAALVDRRLPWSRLRLDLGLGLGLWAVDLGYGLVQWSRPETGPWWRPALVQQSRDPWKGGATAYAGDLDRLMDLTSRGLSDHPDAVVWSETAFVPSVDYHNRYHESPDSLALVRELESYLAASSVPFLLGNEYKEKAPDGRVDHFNAVLAWDQGWKGRYEKNRLVPFTEWFPYKDQLPWMYKLLIEADTHFWEQGRGHNLLTVGGVRVGTPVCFEDAFPDGARAFSLAGAQALVNLTNDSWSSGVASRTQHLSLAVFRTVETGLPLIRAGNDGATASVSSRGEVLDRLPVGPPGVLQARVRLGSGTTLYSFAGDWAPWFLALGLAGAALFRAVRRSVVDKGRQT